MIAQAYPSAKAGAIQVWAGFLYRFAFEMQVGDLVINPYKPDSTLSFGRIESDYSFEPGVRLHPNRRKVALLRTGIPRAQVTKNARYGVGSAVTLFRAKTREAEFVSFVEGAAAAVGANGAGSAPSPASVPAAAVPADEAGAQAEDEPNAERIETYTRDFIIETLLEELEGSRFEYFVANLPEAMGYRTQVTQTIGDGGVDVIAHRDPLGLEPPIIKVRCERTVAASAPLMSRGSPAPCGGRLSATSNDVVAGVEVVHFRAARWVLASASDCRIAWESSSARAPGR